MFCKHSLYFIGGFLQVIKWKSFFIFLPNLIYLFYSDSSNEDRFTLIQANSTSDANDESTEEISTDNSLRKRFPSKPTESNDENKDDSIEDLKPLKDKKNSNNASKPQINNPIRWFSVLAPQSLRSAQKSFLQGLYLNLAFNKFM